MSQELKGDLGMDINAFRVDVGPVCNCPECKWFKNHKALIKANDGRKDSYETGIIPLCMNSKYYGIFLRFPNRCKGWKKK